MTHADPQANAAPDPAKPSRGVRRYLRLLLGGYDCCECGHWIERKQTARMSRSRFTLFCNRCGAQLTASTLHVAIGNVSLLLAVILGLVVHVVVVNWLNLEQLGWVYLTVLPTIFFGALIIFYLLTIPFEIRPTRLDRRQGFCTECGYDLRHVDHQRCPECGASAVDVVLAYKKWRASTGVSNEFDFLDAPG